MNPFLILLGILCFLFWLFHKSVDHHGLCLFFLFFFFDSKIPVLIHSEVIPCSGDVVFMRYPMNPLVVLFIVFCFFL